MTGTDSVASYDPGDDVDSPALDFVARLTVAVGPPVTVGPTALGLRRIVPILGGTVAGPRLRGVVGTGGADYQLVRPDGVTEIEAHYTLRLADGAVAYVTNRGLRHASPDDTQRLLRGEPVPAERVYFRTAPIFESGAPALDWLHRNLFLGIGQRTTDSVVLDVFRVP